MNRKAVDDYGWVSAEPKCSAAYITSRVISTLEQLGVRRVLDLGCGNGHLCGELAKNGYDVVGVESDQRGIEIARKSYPDVQFYQMNVDDAPAGLSREEAPFDVVVSTEVVEHLYSPHHLPEFANMVLCTGGYLVVTTPYHGYLKNLALCLTGKWDSHHDPLWHGGHIKFWSRATLERLLRDGGFDVVGFHGVGRIAYLWKSMMLVGVKNRELIANGRS